MEKKLYSMLFLVCAFGLSLLAQTEVVVRPGDDLIQIVADAGDGDVIVIQPGTYKANYASIIVADKSITIKNVPDSEKPKVHISQINLQGANVGLLVEGIEFSGYDVDSLTGVEIDTVLVSDYFINLDASLTSFSDIIVRDCKVSHVYRSFIRADRSNYTGNGFEIDDCIFNDQRDGAGNNYGPFRLNKNIQFTYFTLKNSTVYNVVNRLIDCENLTGFHQDILIDQCTFYNISGKMTSNNNYMFDFKANPDLTFETKNCIFGKTNDDPASADSIKGWRFADDGATLYTSIITTVFAPDFVVLHNTLDETIWDQKAYVEENVDPEFYAPEDGDFSLPTDSPLLESSDIGEIIGDPRWGPIINGVHDYNYEQSKVLTVYPNPIVGQTATVKSTVNEQVTLVSVLGKEINHFEIKEGINYIDVSGLPSGVYFMLAKDKNLGKFIIR